LAETEEEPAAEEMMSPRSTRLRSRRMETAMAGHA